MVNVISLFIKTIVTDKMTLTNNINMNIGNFDSLVAEHIDEDTEFIPLLTLEDEEEIERERITNSSLEKHCAFSRGSSTYICWT